MMGWEQPSRVPVNEAVRVPMFLTSTTTVEGPIRAAVELHNVFSALHICVDSTCVTACTQNRAFRVTSHRTPFFMFLVCEEASDTVCASSYAVCRAE